MIFEEVFRVAKNDGLHCLSYLVFAVALIGLGFFLGRAF